MKDFGNAKPELVLALLNCLRDQPVFDSIHSLKDDLYLRISKSSDFQLKQIMTLSFDDQLKGMGKYFTVVPANSWKAFRELAPKATAWNYGGLAGVVGAVSTSALMLPPAATFTGFAGLAGFIVGRVFFGLWNLPARKRLWYLRKTLSCYMNSCYHGNGLRTKPETMHNIIPFSGRLMVRRNEKG